MMLPPIIPRAWAWLPLGLSLGLATVSLRAQSPPDPKPTPPAGELVGHVPEAAAWVLQSEAPPAGGTGKPDSEETARQNNPRKERAKPSPAPGPVECTRLTKTGGVLHVELLRGQTVEMDKWYQGEVQATVRPEWSEPLVSVAGNPMDAESIDYSKSDFPELAWIARKNYVGMEAVQDHACLVFRDKIKLADGDGSSIQPTADKDRQDVAPVLIEVVACVDYYSRLPVQFSRGGAVYSYRFGLPPARPLEIPARIQAAVDEYRRHLKDLARPPAKPY